jgi:hypothetical protein
MWVMLDIVPNHSGYFAPENIHEMTFTNPEYYHSCSREYLFLQQNLIVLNGCHLVDILPNTFACVMSQEQHLTTCQLTTGINSAYMQL